MGAKKILVIAAVAAVLAGCNADEDGGKDRGIGCKTVVSEKSLAVCGNSQDFKLDRDLDNVTMAGNSHDVVISGGVEKLKINGNSNDVYIKGIVGTVEINGNSNDVCFVGGVSGSLNIVGNSNDIFLDSIPVYSVSGNSNRVKASTECSVNN